jgi:hypothetical protein
MCRKILIFWFSVSPEHHEPAVFGLVFPLNIMKLQKIRIHKLH